MKLNIRIVTAIIVLFTGTGVQSGENEGKDACNGTYKQGDTVRFSGEGIGILNAFMVGKDEDKKAIMPELGARYVVETEPYDYVKYPKEYPLVHAKMVSIKNTNNGKLFKVSTSLLEIDDAKYYIRMEFDIPSCPKNSPKDEYNQCVLKEAIKKFRKQMGGHPYPKEVKTLE